MNKVYYKQKQIQNYSLIIHGITLLLFTVDAYAFMNLGTNIWEKAFLLAIVVIVGYARGAVIETNAYYEVRQQYEYVGFGKLLILLIAAFTVWSFGMFLAETADSYSKKMINEHYTVKLAQANVNVAKDALSDLEKRHPYTQSELDSAIAEKARLEGEIAKRKQAFEAANSAALAKYNASIAQFWARKAYGIRIDQIMDESCNPKKSPYGGGSMTDAAKKFCPDWKALQAKSPIVNADPEIKELQGKLEETTKIAVIAEQFIKTKTWVANEEKTLLATQEKLSGQEFYPPLFMKLPEISSGYITPFGGVIVFFIFILGIVVGTLMFLSKAVVSLRMELEMNEQTAVVSERTDTQKRTSQLGRIFEIGKGFWEQRKKSSQKQVDSVTNKPMAKTTVRTDAVSDTNESNANVVEKPKILVNNTDSKTTEQVQPSVSIMQPYHDETQTEASHTDVGIDENKFPKDIRAKCMQVIRADQAGKVNSLAVHSLTDHFGFTTTEAQKVRQALVDVGYARFDEQKRCQRVNGWSTKAGFSI